MISPIYEGADGPHQATVTDDGDRNIYADVDGGSQDLEQQAAVEVVSTIYQADYEQEARVVTSSEPHVIYAQVDKSRKT
ncbi:MAG: hypothetical protein AAFO91_07770, partial [Bacteroidota bacterium]